MPGEITPEPLAGPALEVAKLRAGLAAGLTVEQSQRLQGADETALTADATSFAAELNPTPQGPRSGGDRGPDAGNGAGRGTVGAGVAEYRRKNGLDAEGNRPERKPLPTSTRNPFAEPTYRMESR